QHACGLVRAQCGGLAVRLRLRGRHHPQPHQLRAGRLQLRLAGIWDPRGPVAARGRVRRRGRQGDRRVEFAVFEGFPKAIEEMKKRGWEFMGHGLTNSNTLAGLPPEQERETIRTVLKTIEQATGKRPRGWLGPGLIETHNTLDILAEEGVQYCGDW